MCYQKITFLFISVQPCTSTPSLLNVSRSCIYHGHNWYHSNVIQEGRWKIFLCQLLEDTIYLVNVVERIPKGNRSLQVQSQVQEIHLLMHSLIFTKPIQEISKIWKGEWGLGKTGYLTWKSLRGVDKNGQPTARTPIPGFVLHERVTLNKERKWSQRDLTIRGIQVSQPSQPRSTWEIWTGG